MLNGETSRDAIVWERDDYLRGRILPNQRYVVVGPARASFNSLGFRGEEAGDRPIVCLGDSVTFGWGVDNEGETYPALLEKRLRRPGLTVLNAGMPRWNSCDLLDLYATRIARLRPSIVVVLAGWDDIGYEFAPAETEVRGELSLLGSAARNLGLVRAAFGIAERVRSRANVDRVLKDREVGKDSVKWERLEEYESILRSLVVLSRHDGAQPVLVTLPHFLKPGLSDAEKRTLVPHLLAWPNLSYSGWRTLVTRTNASIRKVASATETPLADCEFSVESRNFLDVCHLSAAGNVELANCIAGVVAPMLDQATAIIASPAASRDVFPPPDEGPSKPLAH